MSFGYIDEIGAVSFPSAGDGNGYARRSGESAYVDGVGCFALVEGDSSGTRTLNLINRFYQVGGCIREYLPNHTVDVSSMAGSYVALKVSMVPGGQDTLATYGDAYSMSSASTDLNWYVKPLYKLSSDGQVDIDFRNIPQVASMEMGL